MPVFNSKKFRAIANNAGDKSTTQIAARTGLNRGQVARLLSGDRQPTLHTAACIADAYDTDLDSLVIREEAA